MCEERRRRFELFYLKFLSPVWWVVHPNLAHDHTRCFLSEKSLGWKHNRTSFLSLLPPPTLERKIERIYLQNDLRLNKISQRSNKCLHWREKVKVGLFTIWSVPQESVNLTEPSSWLNNYHNSIDLRKQNNFKCSVVQIEKWKFKESRSKNGSECVLYIFLSKARRLCGVTFIIIKCLYNYAKCDLHLVETHKL